MADTSPFTEYRTFLARHFSGKVQKISINAGFTCPNRDGSLGRGGCTYCNNQTFNPQYCAPRKGVAEQIEEGKAFFARKYPEMQYLAYFQAYTNTYGETERLVSLYEEALAVPGVVGIVIGTRPDCVSNELLDYFSALSRRTFLHIEYGIESVRDEALLQINRGHTFAQTVDAIERTAHRNITVGGHVIVGLPGDTHDSLISQARQLSALPLDTLKFHQLQIIRGTQMAREYDAAPEHFKLFSPEEYVEIAAEMLLHLRADLVVERFTSQSPTALLIAPKWGLKNYEFTHRLASYMAERGWHQGMLAH